MTDHLTDVVLAYDVRFEVQLCWAHEAAVRDACDDLHDLRERLVEATVCRSCNVVGAEYHDDIEDLGLDEALGGPE